MDWMFCVALMRHCMLLKLSNSSRAVKLSLVFDSLQTYQGLNSNFPCPTILELRFF